MDPLDHKRTASHGSGAQAVEYRARQKKLIDEGRVQEAIQMDVNDIRAKFGNKYDVAIKEMQNYAKKIDPKDFTSP